MSNSLSTITNFSLAMHHYSVLTPEEQKLFRASIFANNTATTNMLPKKKADNIPSVDDYYAMLVNDHNEKAIKLSKKQYQGNNRQLLQST